ncbi:MAG TPA: hypothetical protein IAA71_01045 [Candidatus Pullichristensenella stercoripullorum]|nr:hypothetical protein [Candidatus Pullichristensenella stercoripullorum]
MTMKRILCALLCALLLAAVPAMAEDADKDARIAELEAQVAELQAQVDAYHLKELVATFDGGEVPLDEAESLYDLSVTQYAQMGIDVVAYGMDGILREVVVDTLAEEAIVQYMAGELGLGLTEEQQAQFAEEAQATYDSQVDSYYQTYLAGQYESEEDGLAVAAQALDEMGYSYESYLDSLTSTQLSTNVYDYVTKDVAVSEEDVEAAYDEYVAADEANYADPYQFENAFSSGVTIYYTPEGYRNVKHILFKFDDDQATRYDELSTRLADLEAEQVAAAEAADATPAPEAEDGEAESPRAITEIEADIAQVSADLDALYEELMPEAEAAIERFNAGEDIDALIAELNDDTGMPETGYAVSTTAEASAQAWDPAFTEGALSIEEVGGLSAPVRGVYGIHLIYYAGDITPGATALEEVHDEVESLTLQNKISQTYADQISAWKEELHLVTYPEHLA